MKTVGEVISKARAAIDGGGDGVLFNLEGRAAMKIFDQIEKAWKHESEQLKEARNRARLNAIAELRKKIPADCNFSHFKSYDEAWAAFNVMCEAHKHCECPLYRGSENTYGTFECFGRWLWEPFDKGGAK